MCIVYYNLSEGLLVFDHFNAAITHCEDPLDDVCVV